MSKTTLPPPQTSALVATNQFAYHSLVVAIFFAFSNSAFSADFGDEIRS